MCENHTIDTADWKQYHPKLQAIWKNDITAYKPQQNADLPEVTVVSKEYIQASTKSSPQPNPVLYSQHQQVVDEGFANWSNRGNSW
jgi:hypothetical protein